MHVMNAEKKEWTRLDTLKTKLPSRTTAEIALAVHSLAKVVAKQEDMTFQDRGLTAEALLSCVMIEFIERPYAQQVATLRAFVSRFEMNVEGTPLAETRTEGGMEGAPVHGRTVDTSAPRKGRKSVR